MDHVKYTAILILLAVVCVSRGSEYISVCYYTQWSQTSNVNIRLTVDDIDPNLCTHLVYAFGKLDLYSLKLVPTDSNMEDSLGGRQGMYAKFNLLKEKNRKLKTILSIGGAKSETLLEFIQLTSKPESVTKFAHNAVDFLRKRGFDGLDIDWEFPNATDKDNFSMMLRRIREVFHAEAKTSGKRELLLTVAVSAGEPVIKAGYDIPTFSKYVDYIFIMSYDFFGAWSDVTGFNSPLKARSDKQFSHVYNMEYAVKLWMEGVSDKKKIVVGMTGAGVSFKLNNTNNTAVGAPVVKGGGHEGTLFGFKGRLIYQEICMLLSNNYQKKWDEEQLVPYAYHGDQWVGYDDPKSIGEKVKFVMEKKLGGVMFWELRFDDPQGRFCNEGKYPLLSVVKKRFGLETKNHGLTKDVDPGVVLLTKDSGGASSFDLSWNLCALLCVSVLRMCVRL